MKLITDLLQEYPKKNKKQASFPFGSLFELFDGAGYFTIRVALFDGLALVVLTLAFAEGDLNLGLPLDIEINLGGNQRAAALGEFGGELADLFFVQQQFALAIRRRVHVTRLRVGLNVQIIEINLFFFDQRERIREHGFCGAQGFDFRPLQLDAAFRFFGKLVIAVNFSVGGDGFGHVRVDEEYPGGKSFYAQQSI